MSSFILKLIAVCSMLISHTTNYAHLYSLFVEGLGVPQSVFSSILQTVEWFGTIAFPIFAFLISEGCKHTHDKGRYVSRLLVFALISELPFQWMHGAGLLHAATSNIFFTLAIGAIACILFERFWNTGRKFLAVICVLLLVLVGEVWQTDYGGLGVLLIVLPFILKRKTYAIAAMGVVLTVLYMGVGSWNGMTFMWLDNSYYIWRWLVSLLSLVFIALYNGERGKTMKWFFYWFYPAHLAGIVIFNSILGSIFA